jgi:hypothetical protein
MIKHMRYLFDSCKIDVYFAVGFADRSGLVKNVISARFWMKRRWIVDSLLWSSGCMVFDYDRDAQVFYILVIVVQQIVIGDILCWWRVLFAQLGSVRPSSNLWDCSFGHHFGWSIDVDSCKWSFADFDHSTSPTLRNSESLNLGSCESRMHQSSEWANLGEEIGTRPDNRPEIEILRWICFVECESLCSIYRSQIQDWIESSAFSSLLLRPINTDKILNWSIVAHFSQLSLVALPFSLAMNSFSGNESSCCCD